MVEKASDSPDAIAMAYQLGRLDIVSLILGIFGLILAAAAIVGFTWLRWTAKVAAREEARETASRVSRGMAAPEARRAAIEWLENQGISWEKLATMAPIDPGEQEGEDAQAFADALSDNNGDENAS